MYITERELKGVYEITLKPISDSRGYFMRVYDEDVFSKLGLSIKWVQENQSSSERKNIVRGLHFQLPPFTETKLVRCTSGSVLDVFVDLRRESSTLGKWDCIELSDTNKKMIYIPRGFAHGYCTLTDYSTVQYKVDNYYSKESEYGIAWDDTDLQITWPTGNPFLSEKDRRNSGLAEFLDKFKGIDVP